MNFVINIQMTSLWCSFVLLQIHVYSMYLVMVNTGAAAATCMKKSKLAEEKCHQCRVHNANNNDI